MADEFAEWRTTYEVGIPEIDEQHRRLVDMINRLYGSLVDQHLDRFDRAESFDEAVHEVVSYIKQHFADEQAIMKRIDYPGLHAQKEFHVSFVERVVAEAKQFDSGDNLAPNPFVRFLRDWLLQHIAIEDRKIGFYMQEIEARRKSA